MSSNPFDRFDMAGSSNPFDVFDQDYSQAESVDLAVPGLPDDPSYRARQAELARRNQQGHAARRAELAARTGLERAGDTAAFVASMPVRMLTQGKRGLGDVVGMVSPQAGQSLSQSEADFVEYNPDVIKTLGSAGEVAAGIPALNTMGRIQTPANVQRPYSPKTQQAIVRAAESTEDLGAARRLGVELPGIAFNDGPAASIGKQLSETPFVGGPVRQSIQTGIDDTARAAEQVASRYGDVANREQTGLVADAGLRRFRDARPQDVLDDTARRMSDSDLSRTIATPARETSLKSKQSVLYERAWRQIPEAMRNGRAVQGKTRFMQSPTQTRLTLQEIIDRNQKMTNQSAGKSAGALMPVSSGLLGRMLEAVNNPRWSASLQTLRNMRSEIRRLASGMSDTEKNVLRLSDLDRLQSSLTQDMVGLLQRNADAARKVGNVSEAQKIERSIRQFRQSDRFTRLSMQRLETIENLFGASSAEQLAQRIATAAVNKGSGNVEALRTLRRTLRQDEFSQIASGLIRELGTPVGSARGMAQQAEFSVSSFMTRWQNMAPEARQILFAGKHGAAIDDLARVVNRMANVEAMANTSRSASNALNVGTVLASGGAVAAGTLDAVTGLLGPMAAGYTASVLMARPEYTRWMVKYLQLRARMRTSIDGATQPIAEHVRKLGIMAKQDPELADALRSEGPGRFASTMEMGQ